MKDSIEIVFPGKLIKKVQEFSSREGGCLSVKMGEFLSSDSLKEFGSKELIFVPHLLIAAIVAPLVFTITDVINESTQDIGIVGYTDTLDVVKQFIDKMFSVIKENKNSYH